MQYSGGLLSTRSSPLPQSHSLPFESTFNPDASINLFASPHATDKMYSYHVSRTRKMKSPARFRFQHRPSPLPAK
jgi:hypothetical protein